MDVGVYGLGRFGSFWAATLARHLSVGAWSRSQAHPLPPGVVAASEDEVLRAPALFLCVAISAFEEVVGRIEARLAPGAVVFDTCSVKVHPARVMERLIPAGVHIIASHPMFGPDSARNGLAGLPMILSPVRAPEESIRRWTLFFEGLGLRVVRMAPEEHDREAAFTQGVTHYVGRVLADLGLARSRIGTVGYNKLLEIIEQTCNDPWQLFVDLQRYNPFTAAMRARLHESLSRIMSTLEEGSLDTGKERRAQ
jgi:prephenate dehydrogenase